MKPPPATAAPASPAPGAPHALRVVLADDHPVVRSGVRMLLENQAGARVVAEAGTPEELFRCWRGCRPTWS
jgi:two-component system capsular synthesis response regulator RcsB